MLSNSLANFLGVTLSHDLRISDLDYADDIAMLGESFDDIKQSLIRWKFLLQRYE